jgi:pyridoxine kinase
MVYSVLKSVFSIQSHVCFGHVGNAASTFPLQRLGFNVVPVHTTQLSMHKGYKGWAGKILEADHIEAILNGLAANESFPDPTAILTGFLGNEEIGEKVLGFLSNASRRNPQILVHCDPVIGDIGPGAYVTSELVELYRQEFMPLVSCLSPNLFELEQLTDSKLDNLPIILDAARSLIARGPKSVLATSVLTPDMADDEIATLLITEFAAWRVITKKLSASIIPNGPGDLTSALYLANLLADESPEQALKKTVAQVYTQLEAAVRIQSREMMLVANQDLIVSPSWAFDVQKIG